MAATRNVRKTPAKAPAKKAAPARRAKKADDFNPDEGIVMRSSYGGEPQTTRYNGYVYHDEG
jgi:hypothetical protein